MKVRLVENTVHLRGETKEEKTLLSEMWDNGVVLACGGSELGICGTHNFGSGVEEAETNTTLKDIIEKEITGITRSMINKPTRLSEFGKAYWKGNVEALAWVSSKITELQSLESTAKREENEN